MKLFLLGQIIVGNGVHDGSPEADCPADRQALGEVYNDKMIIAIYAKRLKADSAARFLADAPLQTVIHQDALSMPLACHGFVGEFME